MRQEAEQVNKTKESRPIDLRALRGVRLCHLSCFDRLIVWMDCICSLGQSSAALHRPYQSMPHPPSSRFAEILRQALAVPAFHGNELDC